MPDNFMSAETEPVPVIPSDEGPLVWQREPTSTAHHVANITFGICLLIIAGAIAYYVLSGTP